MDYIVNGKHPLEGELSVYGAKNCALALLGASVLTDEDVVLRNCPQIADVENMLCLLSAMGKDVKRSGDIVTVGGSVNTTVIPREQAKLLRGSGLVLGSLVARFHSAFLPSTGGCAIGKRPIDIHLDGLRALGVSISEEAGGTSCVGAPQSCSFTLRFASVGATENLLCAAALVDGEVTLCNCALEPEVTALEKLLVKMGARLDGIGRSVVTVSGVKKLHGAEFSVIPDRIVASTYLACAASAGGNLTVKCNPCHIKAFLNVLETLFEVKTWKDAVSLKAEKAPKSYGRIVTAPYPFFPTDAQQLLLSLCAMSDGGTSYIVEKLFENRLAHNALQLNKMGANVTVVNDTAEIIGHKLHGANVQAGDLRGGAGLVVAALGAEGQTQICCAEHILRGYHNLDGFLKNVGADISVRR